MCSIYALIRCCVWYILSAGCTLFSVTSAVLATPSTQVEYHGFPLQVGQVQELGGGSIKITVGDEAFVSTRSDAAKGVVLRLLRSRPHELDPFVLQNLALRAARASDGDILGAALGIIVTRENLSNFHPLDSWKDIVSSELGSGVLVRLLASLAPEQISPTVCSAMYALRIQQRAVQIESLMTKMGSVCAEKTAQKFLRELFGGVDIDQLMQEVEAVTQRYADDTNRGDGTVDELRTQLVTLKQSLHEVAVESFDRALRQLDAQGQELGLTVQERSQSRLLEQFIFSASEQGAHGAIIKLLPRVLDQNRTPLLHVAVLRALDGLRADEAVASLTDDVLRVLHYYATKDEEIGLHLQQMLQRLAESFIKEGEVESAGKMLRSALDSQGFLPIRFISTGSRLINALLKNAQVGQANQISELLHTGPGVIVRLKLWFANAGLTSAHAGLFLLASVSVLILAWRRISKTTESVLGSSSTTIGQFASTPLSSDLNTARYSEELVQSLAFFGLEPGATLAEIKNAYRNRVKDCHPDRTGANQVKDNAEFVHLTSKYDRLLELYHREEAPK